MLCEFACLKSRGGGRRSGRGPLVTNSFAIRAALGVAVVCCMLFLSTVPSPNVSQTIRVGRELTEFPQKDVGVAALIGSHEDVATAFDDPEVCIVGLAESSVSAYTLFQQWGRFHAFWVVPSLRTDEVPAAYEALGIREPATDVYSVLHLDAPSFHIVPYRPNAGIVTWSHAVQAAMAYSSSKGYQCSHFFIQHDRVAWKQSDAPSGSPSLNPSYAVEIISALMEYRPAVMSFPWKSVDSSFDGARDCAAKWKHLRVAPMTVLDAAVGVYHVSVARFLFPLASDRSPAHQDSLAVVWLNVFVPILFRSHAIRLNTITYTPRIVSSVSFPLPPESFDSKEQLEYVRELAVGLKRGPGVWGPYMTPKDVTWVPSAGPGHYSIAVAAQIYEYYDVSSKPFVAQVQLWKATFIPRFRINVFTYNRIQSLKRLLASLQSAYYPKGLVVALHVFADYAPEAHEQMKETLDAFSWNRGSFEVSFASEHIGLRETILGSWQPERMNEFAVFLEDDIEVSPYFMVYSRACVEQYGRFQNDFLRPETEHVLGCSLYSPIFSQVTNEFESVDNGDVPYLMQEVSSWGAVFFPRPWREYLSWLKTNLGTDPLVPNSETNTWPIGASWKKYLIRLSAERGWGMIFPQLPNNRSMSTNHLEPGTNDKLSGAAAVIARAKFTVPLLSTQDVMESASSATYSMKSLVPPAFGSLSVFDLHRKQLENPGKLKLNLSAFDKATAYVYGTKNVTELRETVIWYAGMRDVFAEVVIMWNNANSAETENVRSLARSETPRYARVRVVTPTLLGFEGTNTPNHRYLPIPACTTWGVFSVESGLRLTSSTIRRGFRGWQQHMTAVVGYRFETRRMLSKPERVAAGGDLLSSNSPLNTKMLMPPSCPRASQTPFNLVLPAAVFFHNRYLQAFTYGSDIKGLQSVRLLVDASRAGADLVFPIVASLVGNRGPVVVEEDEAESIIPARSVALRAADDMEQLIELFENAQANHSLDGLMKPALGLFWKFGEPRPVPCS